MAIAVDFEQVMDVLRRGHEVQIGGGRIFPTYLIRDGQLIVRTSDDGYTDERPLSEESFRQAVAEAPEAFTKVLEYYPPR